MQIFLQLSPWHDICNLFCEIDKTNMKKTKANILLADDDANMSAVLVEYLADKGYLADWAKDGQDALLKFHSSHYDLCLLDISMPSKTVFEVLEEIRSIGTTPVIFLTAHTAKEDIVCGYNLGCDDYVTKPFSPATLYAKSVALINRDKHIVGSHLLSCGEIEIDTRVLKVAVSGEAYRIKDREMIQICQKGMSIEL